MKNVFYFSIKINFDYDLDINEINEKLGLKDAKVVAYNDVKGPRKSAKILYKTKKYEAYYTDDYFERFIKELAKKQAVFDAEVTKKDGALNICIVFDGLKEKPCLYISNDTIKDLANLNASFDVDII